MSQFLFNRHAVTQDQFSSGVKLGDIQGFSSPRLVVKKYQIHKLYLIVYCLAKNDIQSE